MMNLIMGYFLFKFIQDMMFYNALEYVKKEGVAFFDPMVFTNNINNYITSIISKKFKIRGFSNSYRLYNKQMLLLYFKYSNCNFGIFVDISKNIFIKIKILIFSKKEFTFL